MSSRWPGIIVLVHRPSSSSSIIGCSYSGKQNIFEDEGRGRFKKGQLSKHETRTQQLKTDRRTYIYTDFKDWTAATPALQGVSAK